MNFISVLFLIQSALAALPPPQGRSINIESSEDVKITRSLKPEVIEREKSEIKIVRGSATRDQASKTKTNLPKYYEGERRSTTGNFGRVVFVPNQTGPKLKGVRSGDVFTAIIDQSIKASPSVPTPIRARVISGGLLGSYFIGEATLDKELKRILFQFTKVRTQSDELFQVRASGLSGSGQIGLEGDYNSGSGRFFVAEMASATAAGVLDSTINRQQTINGGFVQEPSLSNSAKTGAVTALSRTADRMAEGARQAPEYTELEGFQKIQIIIQEEPTEAN